MVQLVGLKSWRFDSLRSKWQWWVVVFRPTWVDGRFSVFTVRLLFTMKQKQTHFSFELGIFALRASLRVFVWVLICLHSLRVGGFQASKVFLKTKLLQSCNFVCLHGNCDEELNYSHMYLLNHICGPMIKDKMVDRWNIILSAAVNQQPPVHHEGWMVSDQETIFCWVRVP